MPKGKQTSSPLDIAMKALRDERGTSGESLTLDQIASKYYGGDRTKASIALSVARKYADARTTV